MYSVEDLGVSNIKIYQKDGLYKFTSDSILLAKFSKVKKGDVVADFCSGSGIVGLNLYGLNANLIKSVTLFEMQTSEMHHQTQRCHRLLESVIKSNILTKTLK